MKLSVNEDPKKTFIWLSRLIRIHDVSSRRLKDALRRKRSTSSYYYKTLARRRAAARLHSNKITTKTLKVVDAPLIEPES